MRSTRVYSSSSHLSVLMIDHNVVRLHVSVHNSLAVAEIESLEQFEDIKSDIDILKLGIQASEVGVVDIFKDQRRSLTLVRG